jgi:DNA-binding NtrC family response regulator
MATKRVNVVYEPEPAGGEGWSVAPDGPPRVLVVGVEGRAASLMAKTLGRLGCEVYTGSSTSEGLDVVDEASIDLVVLDPGCGDLEAAVEAFAEVPKNFLVAPWVDARTAREVVSLFELGAHHVFHKPLRDFPRFQEVVRRAVKLARTPWARIKKPPGHVSGIAGNTEGIRAVREQVRQVAVSDVTVLVEGPTGAGKELVAKALHDASGRDGNFETINIGGFSADMLKSELFGHVRGSHATAYEDRRGYVAMAKGGTLFLDEIGDLALEAQVLLLRLLENRTYRPIGGEEAACEARIVAATNRDLREEVRAGRFREDLYYRLARYCIEVPALSARGGDIEWLAWHAVALVAPDQAGLGWATGELDRLERYEWPGNVRELVNAVGKSFMMGEGASLEPSRHMSESTGADEVVSVDREERAVSWVPLQELEALGGNNLTDLKREGGRALARAWLDRLLRECGGNVTRVAERVGVKSTNLYREFQKLGMEPKDYR